MQQQVVWCTECTVWACVVKAIHSALRPRDPAQQPNARLPAPTTQTPRLEPTTPTTSPPLTIPAHSHTHTLALPHTHRPLTCITNNATHLFTNQPQQWPKVLNASLSEVDPELYDIIEKEKNRQYKVRIGGQGGGGGLDVGWERLVSTLVCRSHE
jgi:hypothetical protein